MYQTLYNQRLKKEKEKEKSSILDEVHNTFLIKKSRKEKKNSLLKPERREG